MTITVWQDWTTGTLTLLDRTPDRHLIDWPGLIPFGALYRVEGRIASPTVFDALRVAGLDLLEVGVDPTHWALWYAERGPELPWVRLAFWLIPVYWKFLLLLDGCWLLTPDVGERFSWRRHFRPWNPLRVAWLVGVASVFKLVTPPLMRRWRWIGRHVRLRTVSLGRGKYVTSYVLSIRRVW